MLTHAPPGPGLSGRPPHTGGMPRPPLSFPDTLPEVLKTYPALAQLVWLYVYAHPGEIPLEDVSTYYGHHYQTTAANMRLLVRNGLVIVVQQGKMIPLQGREAATYRVAEGDELERAAPYTPVDRSTPERRTAVRAPRRPKGASDA